MSKYYLIFGGVAGAICIAIDYLVFSQSIPFSKGLISLPSKVAVLMISIAFCTILIKKIHGKISFLRTTFGGVMIALICSSVSGMGYSFMHYPDGKFLEPIKEYSLQQWQEQNKDKPNELAKIEGQKLAIDKQFSVLRYSIMHLGLYFFMGILISAFMAAIIGDKTSFKG